MASISTDTLSPLDGRYAGKLAAVRYIFSEAGLMRERVRVECAWFLALASGPAAPALAGLPPAARGLLEALSTDPAAADVPAIKQIEARTNHDVKAVEIWLRKELGARGASAGQPLHVLFRRRRPRIERLANMAFGVKRVHIIVILHSKRTYP